MSKRNRPPYQNRSQLPPSRDPDLKTDYIGMVLQILETQFSGLMTLLGRLLGDLSQALRSSLLVYIIWLGSILFPLWEDASFMSTFPQSLSVMPMLFSFLILVASLFNLRFEMSDRVPRLFWSLLFFPLPFLQTVNVSGQENRPSWTCLALWDSIALFSAALYVGHFSMGIAAPITVVMSFSALLFR